MKTEAHRYVIPRIVGAPNADLALDYGTWDNPSHYSGIYLLVISEPLKTRLPQAESL
jgi:hypothetical protein